MTDQEEHDRAGTMSVQDMQGWLRDELRDSAKAQELRSKEATEFVKAYAEGKLTPEEALERLVQYDLRWGEALFGASARSDLSDSQIVEMIDKARNESLDPGSRYHTERLKRRTGASTKSP